MILGGSLAMTLCFGALMRVLRYCSKQGVHNKNICEALLLVFGEYYAGMISGDDSAVSHLTNCTYNLSPTDVVTPARSLDSVQAVEHIRCNVLPLLDENKYALAVLALSDIILKDESIQGQDLIGHYTKNDLAIKATFNIAEFLSDIFLYTVISVDNKCGKNSIKSITPEYVRSFEQYKNNISFEITSVVEMEELACTLDDGDFSAVFREVEHGEALDLSNKSDLKLHYLDISDSAFDYAPIGEYLLDCASMYVYSRTQIKDFEDRHKVRSMGVKALRQMMENGQPDEKGTGNELGGMLLFTFMEGALHAPKLLSKVEIVTAAQRFHSNSDSIHLLKRKVNGRTSYQLVFGASSINGNIKVGIDNVFSAIQDIKSGRVNERHMVDSTLLNHTFDDETTARLHQILVPSRDRTVAPDMAFGVFVAYSLGIACDDNEQFRIEAVQKMIADIKSCAPYIAQKVRDLSLGMHSFYFYFLPLNDAENDKKQIMSELLGGV